MSFDRMIHTRRSRKAFTLIELLVVIAVIALLISLTAGAYFLLMTTTAAGTTKTNVTKIQKALASQYQTVLQNAAGTTERIDPNVLATILPVAGNDASRARVIYVKLRLKQAFPTSFAEALGPTPLNPLPGYVRALSQAGVNAGNLLATPAPYESAACLWLALQKGTSGGGGGDELGKGMLKTFATQGGQIQALVDVYGIPLNFSRWPTGVPGAAQTGFNDPEDPQGLLNNAAWLTSVNPATMGANLTQFQTWCHALPTTATTSLKLRPTVLSAGPDRLLGLDPTTLSPLTADANDNIYSR